MCQWKIHPPKPIHVNLTIIQDEQQELSTQQKTATSPAAPEPIRNPSEGDTPHSWTNDNLERRECKRKDENGRDDGYKTLCIFVADLCRIFVDVKYEIN